jgi:twitching motility protein PilJ
MESGTLEVVEGTKLASEAKTHPQCHHRSQPRNECFAQNITRASAKQTGASAEEISNSMQQVNETANTTVQKGSMS